MNKSYKSKFGFFFAAALITLTLFSLTSFSDNYLSTDTTKNQNKVFEKGENLSASDFNKIESEIMGIFKLDSNDPNVESAINTLIYKVRKDNLDELLDKCSMWMIYDMTHNSDKKGPELLRAFDASLKKCIHDNQYVVNLNHLDGKIEYAGLLKSAGLYTFLISIRYRILIKQDKYENCFDEMMNDLDLPVLEIQRTILYYMRVLVCEKNYTEKNEILIPKLEKLRKRLESMKNTERGDLFASQWYSKFVIGHIDKIENCIQ